MSKLSGFFGTTSRRSSPHGRRLRVAINALHAKSGGGVTYLRNMLPLLADDQRLELHIFLHRSQLALFHPLDERIIVHAFDFPLGMARLIAWEQLVLPFMTHIMSADLVFSPANFGSIFVRDQVIVLRNALAVAKTETRWNKRIYWVALGIITFISLILCKRAIAVSHYAANSLSLGCSRFFNRKIKVIYHGISAIFSPDPTIERQGFLLAVSDIYVQKNLHTLMRAMALVLAKYPNVKLMIAGEKIDIWYYNKVVQLAQELNIYKNMHFLGRLESKDILSLYRQCQVFVFPSTAETFGNPLVEAMACGTPIASSNVAAMPEIVNDAALLFDPLDVEDMAGAIMTLLGDAGLRHELGQKGQEKAKAFSWSETARQTAQILVEAHSQERS